MNASHVLSAERMTMTILEYMKIWQSQTIFRSVAFSCLMLLLACAPTFAQDDLFEALQIARFDEAVAAPDFSLPLLGQETAGLGDYKGKWVLLNFWATWCPHCQTERDALQTTYEKYKDRGFVVLSVSIDRGSIETVRKFVDEHGLTFPNMHDKESAVASQYGVRGVPSTILINPSGEAIAGVIGPREWDSPDMHRLIESLLADPS